MSIEACPDCGGAVSSSAPACPHCGRPRAAAPVVQVRATQGATGKFLDPGANARSCLGCFALLFVTGVAVVVWFALFVR